jgi:hypothetical protein
MVFVEIPLSWIKDIQKLTCTNLTANALIFYGHVLCLGYHAFDEATFCGCTIARGVCCSCLFVDLAFTVSVS